MTVLPSRQLCTTPSVRLTSVFHPVSDIQPVCAFARKRTGSFATVGTETRLSANDPIADIVDVQLVSYRAANDFFKAPHLRPRRSTFSLCL